MSVDGGSLKDTTNYKDDACHHGSTFATNLVSKWTVEKRSEPSTQQESGHKPSLVSGIEIKFWEMVGKVSMVRIPDTTPWS